MNIKLSPNFWLSELVKSQTADRYSIDNWPKDAWIIDNLIKTTSLILQPVRDHFKTPFAPNSGYRSLELNRRLGSKDSSQHTKGQAVDFEVPGVSNYDLAVWVQNNLDFDQLILEFYQRGVPNSGWVHCSYVSGETNRREVLSLVKGEGFVRGLVE